MVARATTNESDSLEEGQLPSRSRPPSSGPRWLWNQTVEIAVGTERVQGRGEELHQIRG